MNARLVLTTQETNVKSYRGPGLTGDKVLFHARALCNQLTAVDVSWSRATDVGVLALVQGVSRYLTKICPALPPFH